MQLNDDSTPASAPAPTERSKTAIEEWESAVGAGWDAARRHLDRPGVRAALMGGLVTVTAASIGVPELLAAVGASYIALRTAGPRRLPPSETTRATLGALGDALTGIGTGVALSRLLRSRAIIGHALGSGYAAYRRHREKSAPGRAASAGAQKTEGEHRTDGDDAANGENDAGRSLPSSVDDIT